MIRRGFSALLLGAGLLGSPAAVLAEASYLGTYVWTVRDPHFGGFSGLEVSDDGTRFVALSDRAWIVDGVFERTDGVIAGVRAGPLVQLDNGSGAPLDEERADSEGLAIAPDGERFISFEGVARIRTETGPDGGDCP